MRVGDGVSSSRKKIGFEVSISLWQNPDITGTVLYLYQEPWLDNKRGAVSAGSSISSICVAHKGRICACTTKNSPKLSSLRLCV